MVGAQYGNERFLSPRCHVSDSSTLHLGAGTLNGPSKHTQNNICTHRQATMRPPITSFDSHPCQQSFPLSSFPTVTVMEKATLLKGFICLRVCFSLFAFIFIFYDCPLLPFKLPRETGAGCGEVGEEGGVGEDRGGALLKENEEN